ncbi:hypothetical protein BT63DRAFT_483023 [Microthyrium microscopicum]|uniref:DUF7053 domain-containing protein n=1 Tax=Microthyrium microscopicum TaxID=703497 RepID=A0A6A6U0F1_9PEZI|nr:hypothetical protein BT63DRAFT_483023 [Microthyrium microscopicum]
MSTRTVFATVTPLPTDISHEVVLDTLHDHGEMIDLNPLVIRREKLDVAPACAEDDEVEAIWYAITDKISYLPGGLYTGELTFYGCFNDLSDGLQTHVHAPMGVEIKSRWTLGGNRPGEPWQPVELGVGAPQQGLYLKEEVDLRCNFLTAPFVKKQLKESHGTVVDLIIEKAKTRQLPKTDEPPGLTPPVLSPRNYNANASPFVQYPSSSHNQSRVDGLMVEQPSNQTLNAGSSAAHREKPLPQLPT